MNQYRIYVGVSCVLWILICGSNHVAATTRRPIPFAGRAMPRMSGGGAETNATTSEGSTGGMKQEDKGIGGSPLSGKKGPVSNWFSRMNQKSIQKEEEQRQGRKDDEKEEARERKNQTATTNNTTSSKWPQGRYWPTSSSSSRQEKSPPVSSKETDDEPTDAAVSPLPDETDDSTIGTTIEQETDSTKSESPVTFSLPSLNLFQSLRRRLHPQQQVDEEPPNPVNKTTEEEAEDSTKAPKQEEVDLEPNSLDSEVVPGTTSEPSDSTANGTNVLTKIQEAAMNAKNFFLQLPWQPQPQNDTVISDVYDTNATMELDSIHDDLKDEVRSDELESSSTDEPAIDEAFLDAIDAIDPPVDEKVLEERTPKSLTGQSRGDGVVDFNITTRVVSRNPISIVRNLPWTPKRGKKYIMPPEQQAPIQVNPIQFLRGLPWTPQRRKDDGDGSDGNGTSVDSNVDSGKKEHVISPSASNKETPTDELSTDISGETTIDDSGLSFEGTAESAVTESEPSRENEDPISLESGTNRQLTLAEEGLHDIEKESDSMAMEVEDVLSNYLHRQEESASSSEDDKEEDSFQNEVSDDDSIRENPTTTMVEMEDKKETIPAADEESLTVEIKEETSSDDSDKTPSLSLDSMVRRILGSFEQQEKSIEEKQTAKQGTNTSDTTSTKKNETETSERSSDPSSEDESVPVSNKTALPSPDQGKRQKQLPPIPQQQQQQPTVIIIGGGPQEGRALPGDLGRRPVPTPSLVLVEALATILGTAIRIWMVSFLAKWWTEEETLRPAQHFVWERVNDRYLRDSKALQNVLTLPPTGVTEWKWRRYLRKQHRVEGKIQKKEPLPRQTFARTVIVLSIGPEMNIPHLEQAVTFILSQHREQAFGSIGGLGKELEVILLVDSPGGSVQDFGLAGAQVRRLAEEAGVTTTACVDQIAASGGYMIASQADRIFASNFAIVGSIGVIREGINIHDALERHGIKGLVLKAGDSKVPLTMLGPVTKSDLSKAQRTLNLMHDAFKAFVVRGRPRLEESIDDVANGDVSFGEEALDQLLIDRIVTSDEYVLERVQAGDRVMKLHRAHQFIGRRKLFHPLDFLREKGAPLRAALSKWIASDTESILTRAVAATSVVGVAQFLAQHRFFFGGEYGAR